MIGQQKPLSIMTHLFLNFLPYSFNELIYTVFKIEQRYKAAHCSYENESLGTERNSYFEIRYSYFVVLSSRDIPAQALRDNMVCNNSHTAADFSAAATK